MRNSPASQRESRPPGLNEVPPLRRQGFALAQESRPFSRESSASHHAPGGEPRRQLRGREPVATFLANSPAFPRGQVEGLAHENPKPEPGSLESNAAIPARPCPASFSSLGRIAHHWRAEAA